MRVVDKASARTDKSKALVIWSRTLELLDGGGGGAAPFVTAGSRMLAINFVAGDKVVGRIGMADVRSPYPFGLMLPQSDTERLLEERLAGQGVAVERKLELLAFSHRDDGVDCVLRRAEGHEEAVPAGWLVGCDGAHSVVRRQLGAALWSCPVRCGCPGSASTNARWRTIAGAGFPGRRRGPHPIPRGVQGMNTGMQDAVNLAWKVALVAQGAGQRARDNRFEPWASIAGTAPWMIPAREALGPGVILGIDYHHRLSVAEAAAFRQRMPLGTLDWIEEPIRDEAPEAYEALRRMTPIPFALGEEFASKWQFLPYIERGITQYTRIDVCNVGGFMEAMKVAGWSEAHYVDLMPHNPLGPICTAATIQLAAAVPNFAWLECRATPAETYIQHDSAELFPVRPVLDGAVYPVSDAPGLGIEVDEALVRRDPFRFSEPPHLRRTDGSYTSW